MSNIKISVIIPVYNVEKYLDRCINTVISQTLKDIEIILVDDGSPDNCPYICDEWAKKDERIKVIHKQNEGLGFARNTGLEIANGEYVTFVDSDDYISMDGLSTLYSYACQGHYDIVYGGVQRVLQDGNIVPYLQNIDKEFVGTDNVLCYLGGMIACGPGDVKPAEYPCSVWSGIFRLSIIKNNTIKFKREQDILCEDIVFHIELYQFINSVRKVKSNYYYYCDNPGENNSLTKTFKKSKIKALQNMWNEFESSPLFNSSYELRLRAYRLLINYSHGFLHSISKSSYSFSEKRKLIKETINFEPYIKAFHIYPVKTMPIKWRTKMYTGRKFPYNIWVKSYIKKCIKKKCPRSIIKKAKALKQRIRKN